MIYTGDCLDIMKVMDPESVDLIYADPPFPTYEEWSKITARGTGYEKYVSFVIDRVREMHRILKDTGSLYLHCDLRISHYIKIEVDSIFGMGNFRNEIAWCFHRLSRVTKTYQRMHTPILFYTKTPEYVWNNPMQKKAPGTRKYRQERKLDWATKEFVWTVDKTQTALDRRMTDVWDVARFSPMKKERVGYPTQKPQALLERIVIASSNIGDTVLDPFCGSGSMLVCAENLNRKAVGIDTNSETEKYYLLLRKQLDGELLVSR